jgi:hypothetical protein
MASVRRICCIAAAALSIAADAAAQDSDRSVRFGLSLEYSRLLIVSSVPSSYSGDDLWTLVAGITAPAGDARAVRLYFGPGMESGFNDVYWLAGANILFNAWGDMSEGVFVGLEYLYSGDVLCLGRYSRWDMDAGEGLMLTAGAAWRLAKPITTDLFARMPLVHPRLGGYERTILLLGARLRFEF